MCSSTSSGERNWNVQPAPRMRMSTGVVGEVERLVEVDGGGGLRVERAVIRVIFEVWRWYGWS